MSADPARSHGPWKILQSQEIYRDPWMTVRKDDVIRPDGLPGSHGVVHLKPGVCVLPLDEAGTVFLTEEFHYGVGRYTLEAVSGGCEPGEESLVTARRELQEELGIEASHWLDLGCVDPFTTNVVSPTQLFLARRLRHGNRGPEGTELIRCVSMPLANAVAQVMAGVITHAPTAVLILKTWHTLGGPSSDHS
jgi:ADP-ribose pyrophosphatase